MATADGRNSSVGKGEPIDRQRLPFTTPDGDVEHIPAIDARWCSPLEYGRYECLLSVDHILVHSWQQCCATLLHGVKFALRLPMHRFWSTVLHDDDFGRMLDSFLRTCPRPCDGASMQLAFYTVKDATNGIMLELYRHVLLLVVRLACRTESDVRYLSDEFYASVVCTPRALSLSRLVDICAVYAPSNGKLVRKMVRTLCTVQPSVHSDFEALPQLLCRSLDRASRDAAASILLQQSAVHNTAVEKDSSRELCHYAADLLYTIDQILVAYPRLYALLFEAKFADRLCTFVSSVCAPAVRRLSHMKHVLGGFHTDKPPLRGRLDYFITGAVSLFHRLALFNCLYPVLDDVQRADLLRSQLDPAAAESFARPPLGTDKAQCGQTFYHMLHGVLEHKEFVWQYNETYPILQQFDRLRERGCLIEHDQIGFMVASLQSINTDLANDALENLRKTGLLKELSVACDSGDTRSKVQFICDMLPQLAPAFVQLCLMHFNVDQERTLDALLALHHADGAAPDRTEHFTLPRDLLLLRHAPQSAFDAHGAGGGAQAALALPHADARPPIAGFKDLLDLKPSSSGARQEQQQQRQKSDNNAPVAAATNDGGGFDSADDEVLHSVADAQTDDGQAKLTKLATGKKHNAGWSPERGRAELKSAAAHVYAQYDGETPFDQTEMLYGIDGQDTTGLYDDEYDDTYDGQICVDDAGAIEERLAALRSGNPNRNGTADGRGDDESGSPDARSSHCDNSSDTRRRDNRREAGAAAPSAASQPAPAGSADYTGGRQRQLKDRHRAQAAKHDRKWRSAKKMSQGMG